MEIYFSQGLVLKRLTNCLNNLNKKHNSIKFDYKISQTSITFLDTEVSIQNNKLIKKKSIRKSTDLQNFFHIDSEQPKSLKDTIPYNEPLKNKHICTKPNDFNEYCEELKQRFVSQCYKPELIHKHMKAVEKMDRKEFLNKRHNTTSKETKIC